MFSFRSLFNRGAPQGCPQPEPVKPRRQRRLKTTHRGPKYRVTAHLIRTGWIDAMTAQRVGRTTDARKMFTELRRDGLLFAADDPKGHEELKNASGVGTYRRHKWTGKKPAGWKGE